MPIVNVAFRLFPAVAAILVIAVDMTLRANDFPLLIAGALDESAHLATTCLLVLLLLILMRQMQRRFVAAALVSTVMIDIDHVPGELGYSVLTEGTNRPYAHSFVTVVTALLLATLHSNTVRQVMLGTAYGFAAHLVRDSASPTGVPLLWPLSPESITIPYIWYATGIIVVASVLLVRLSRQDNLVPMRILIRRD